MKTILSILGIVGITVGLAFVFAFPVMWLWNYLMPEICGFQPIGFWQAFLLMVLGKFIAGSGSSSSRN